MRFLDVFNEIQKGDYALTDEAVYHSLQNGDELIPLYGGNKSHNRTDRKISITAKTKKGVLGRGNYYKFGWQCRKHDL